MENEKLIPGQATGTENAAPMGGVDAGMAQETAVSEAPKGADGGVDKTKPAQKADTDGGKSEVDFKKLLAEKEAEFASREKAAIDKAVEDALKKAKMSADERGKYEAEQKERLIAERETAITLRELRADAAVILNEKKIPLEYLDMVIGANKEDTLKRIDSIKAVRDKDLEAQRVAGLAGSTPRGGTSSVGYTMEQIKRMTPDEINKNWDKIQDTLKKG